MTDEEVEKETARAAILAGRVGGALAILLGLTAAKEFVVWDPGKVQFIVNGRYVSIETVRLELRRFETVVGVRMRKLADALAAGDIDLDQWRIRMREIVGSSHVVMAALAAGGIAAAAGSKFVHSQIIGQRKFIPGFARDITIKRLSPAAIAARAKSYLLSAATTHGVVEQTVHTAAGFTEARRVRTAAESCEGCITWSDKWYLIGVMPIIGSLDCGDKCRCFLEYR